jgi:hypothetical protein
VVYEDFVHVELRICEDFLAQVLHLAHFLVQKNLPILSIDGQPC